MNLSEVIERAEADLRTLARALALTNHHADALRFLAYAAIVKNDLPEKFAKAEEARKQLEAVAVEPKTAPLKLCDIPETRGRNKKKAGGEGSRPPGSYLAASG